MTRPPHLDPTRPTRERRAALSSVVCPGCWCHGRLVETVPPTRQHQGHFQCPCGWCGPGVDLTPKPADERATQAELTRCRLEDQRRGEPGGGSSSKGRTRKGDDRLRRTTLRRHVDEELAWQKIRAAEPRTEVVRVPGARSTAEELRAKLGAYITAQFGSPGDPGRMLEDGNG